MEKHYRFMLDENQRSDLVNILLEKWETWKQAGDTRASLACDAHAARLQKGAKERQR